MTRPTILWGSMGPDSHRVDFALEQAVGKRQSLPHLALAWAYGRNADGSLAYAPFPNVGGQPNPYSFLTAREYPTDVPVYMDWVSWDLRNQADPAFSLDAILAGKHDPFLHSWFKAAAAFKRPVLVRFDAEMNGTWWPNFGAVQGAPAEAAQAAKYVAMWRYVVQMARADGATNIGWHWCPNVCATPGNAYPTASDRLHWYYPGDDVVDWTGFDAYNWFTGTAQFDAAGKQTGGWLTPWMTFSQIIDGYPQWLGPTYDTILQIAPNKPMCLGEFNCWDDPRKPAWLLDAMAEIPVHFPAIRAISLFNWPASGAKWPILGGTPSAAALALGLASDIYLPAGAWTPPDMQPPGPPPLVLDVTAPIPAGYAWPSWQSAATDLAAQLRLQTDMNATLKASLADATSRRAALRAAWLTVRSLIEEAT